MNGAPRNPPQQPHGTGVGVWVGFAAGAAVGVSVGALATWWVMTRARPQVTVSSAKSEEEVRQLELLVRLADHTGYEGFDPTKHPVEQIVKEIQVGENISPADGKWSLAVERAVLDLLGERPPSKLPPRANPSDPALELEPDDNWEATYEARFPEALRTCCEADEVISFDQAVVAVHELVFPEHGSFCLAPGTGEWKKMARARARDDLARMIGPTEVEARAVLVAPVGRQALQQGADLGQAVRVMAERAWPTVRWDMPRRQPWQDAFVRAATSSLQAA